MSGYENFERLCRERGVSANKIAKETGINPSTIYSWKRGDYMPKPDKIKKMADYLGVSAAELYGEEEPSPALDFGFVDAAESKKEFFQRMTAYMNMLNKESIQRLLDSIKEASDDQILSVIKMIESFRK